MNYDLDETFVIDNDNKADWALRVIKDNEAERDRLVSIAKNQIEDLESQIEEIINRYDNKSSFLKSCLAQYSLSVPRKQTKTQETYQLLSGKLIIKKASQKMIPNDEKLLEYLTKEKQDQFIKIKQSPDWAEFKKSLQIMDGYAVNTTTGEVIPTDIITIEDVPASFDIKLNKEEE